MPLATWVDLKNIKCSKPNRGRQIPFDFTHVESINKNKLIGTKNKLMDPGGKKSGGFGQKVRGLSTTILFSRKVPIYAAVPVYALANSRMNHLKILLSENSCC